MTTDSELQVIAVVAVCVAGVLVVGAGAVATESSDTGAIAAIQETTPADEESQVSIQNFSAPDRVQIGENYTVSADMVNEDDQKVVRRVTYQIGGNVIGSELVQISAGNTTTVMFNVTGDNTSGFPTGTFTHGVFTEDAEATANLTLVAADETTPAETTPEETTPVETTPEEARAASVTFENQTSNGTAVVVNSVTVPEAGFVVIHDLGVVEGEAVESMVGTSEFLEAGTHQNVTVELDESLNESQRLVAVVYRDSNENQEFDFVTSNRTADGPYRQPGEQVAVNDFANVTVENEEEQ